MTVSSQTFAEAEAYVSNGRLATAMEVKVALNTINWNLQGSTPGSTLTSH